MWKLSIWMIFVQVTYDSQAASKLRGWDLTDLYVLFSYVYGF